MVATVIQRIGENGQLTISVESPGPEQNSGITKISVKYVLS